MTHGHAQLVFRLLARRPSTPPSLGDDAFRDVASALVENGLVGLVYSEHRDLLSQAQQDEFKSVWRKQWARNRLLLDEIARIDANASCPLTILKGGALLEELYRDLGARLLSDLDFLVAPADLERASNSLKAIGYRDVTPATWRANEFKRLFTREIGGIESVIELHTRLHWREPEGFEWRSRAHGDFAHVRRLAREDELLHLCLHLGPQHTFLRLSWLLDIDRHVAHSGDTFAWDEFWTRCDSLGQTRAVALVLACANARLGTPIPIGTVDLADRIGLRLLDESYLLATSRHRLRYLALKHLAKASLGEALQYDLGWLKSKCTWLVKGDAKRDV